MNDEQKILSTQKLLDIISKKNTVRGNEKASEMPRVRLNNTKDRKRPWVYLFVGVFTGIIATGGVFYLLNSPPESTPAKPTATAIVQTASSPDSHEKQSQKTDSEKIQNAISDWKTAWEQKDIDAYKVFYSPVFHTGKFDRRTWLGTKEKNFRRPGGISISIDELTISVTGHRAVATFVQRHKSPGLTDRGKKTLVWTKENNEWKIVSETWKPLKK